MKPNIEAAEEVNGKPLRLSSARNWVEQHLEAQGSRVQC